MNEETRPWVELAALQLAGLVVAAHLYWGLDRLAGQLQYGVYVDPRPIAFVLSSMVIIAGAIYAALGGRRKPVYLAGIALMLVYMFGYWAWHLVGHVPAMPWVESQPHPHPEWGPVETLIRHITNDDLALFSKIVEAALAIVLAVLYLDERGREQAAGSGSVEEESPPGSDAATESTSEADAP